MVVADVTSATWETGRSSSGPGPRRQWALSGGALLLATKGVVLPPVAREPAFRVSSIRGDVSLSQLGAEPMWKAPDGPALGGPD